MLKKKLKKVVKLGLANIYTSFNNTIITFTDIVGNTICWASSGTSGFKGARKNTPFAAETAVLRASKTALDLGVEKVQIIIKGCGNGRESAIKAIKASGLSILTIQDKILISHNGCRPPKKRRL